MKKKAKIFFYIFILLLTACNKKTNKIKPFTDDKTPAYGDMFISSSIGDASYLNPILATDSASGEINNLIYNGLVKYDKNLKLTGDLAERWSVSPDNLKITFYLKKNILWHDGFPFTAEDVKFTYEKLIDPNVKTPYSSDFLIIKNFKLIDESTIEITYKEPFAPALESWGIGIVPEHIFSKGDFNTNPANRSPTGTGPYKFKEWKTDEKIVLEANKNYFEGKPFINRYIYRIIPDQAVQFLELRKESIDEMNLTPDQSKAYPEFFLHYTKFRYPAFTYTYLAFNLNIPLFNNKKFRHAVACCIDKKEIINGVLLGMGKAANGPFPPQSWAYDDSVKDIEFNVSKGKELLKQLGWIDSDGDGYLDKNGKPLEFTIITNQGNKMRSLTAEIIQAQLKKAGIKVNVRIIEWSAFVHQFVDKHNFEAIIMGWSLSRDPDQYSIWNSSQTHEGQYNFISYSNHEVDRLLTEGRKIFDQHKRKIIYNKFHRIIADDLPYIFLYYPESLPVVHNRFKGVELAPAGIGWNFYKWWVPRKDQKYLK